MKTYIVEISLIQTDEESDAAWAADSINGLTYKSIEQIKFELLDNHKIDKVYFFTPAQLVASVNDGNDSFGDSYLAYVIINN